METGSNIVQSWRRERFNTRITMENKENNAIELLNMLCGNSGCVISDSGGKDSSVLKHIAMKTREKYNFNFSIQHNHTTVDAPETVYFVRDEKRKYEAAGIKYNILYPQRSIWQLIVDHCTPPTRLMRYCCADLKEYSGHGEKLVTGVRKSESKNRKDNQSIVTFPKPKQKIKEEAKSNKDLSVNKQGGVIVLNLDNAETRQLVENCYRTTKTLINPLIDWEDDYLWWYIRKENIELNPLYSCGQCRIGCIGCPIAGDKRWAEFERYPKYKEAYIRAFDKMLKESAKDYKFLISGRQHKKYLSDGCRTIIATDNYVWTSGAIYTKNIHRRQRRQ